MTRTRRIATAVTALAAAAALVAPAAQAAPAAPAKPAATPAAHANDIPTCDWDYTQMPCVDNFRDIGYSASNEAAQKWLANGRPSRMDGWYVGSTSGAGRAFLFLNPVQGHMHMFTLHVAS